MRKWIVRATVLLLVVAVFAFIGVSPISATLIRHLQPQPQSTADNGDGEQEPLNGSCGVERWSVKTGTDAGASLLQLQSTTPTTISALTSLAAPSNIPANNRVQPTETTVFQLHATLTEYKLEADSDYHLILSDGSGNTMIGEIPSPSCVGSNSVLLPDIQKARAEFDARYTTTDNFQTANVGVTVTGVGFFDFLHGQAGVAPNGIELHPVLDIQFDTNGSPTPLPTTTPIATPTGTSTATPTSTPTVLPTATSGGF